MMMTLRDIITSVELLATILLTQWRDSHKMHSIFNSYSTAQIIEDTAVNNYFGGSISTEPETGAGARINSI